MVRECRCVRMHTFTIPRLIYVWVSLIYMYVFRNSHPRDIAEALLNGILLRRKSMYSRTVTQTGRVDTQRVGDTGVGAASGRGACGARAPSTLRGVGGAGGAPWVGQWFPVLCPRWLHPPVRVAPQG